MRVFKFGGTSVGTPERMRHVAALVRDKRDIIVVVSAQAGTTDKLLEISQMLIDQQVAGAVREIDVLRHNYHAFADSLFSSSASRGQSMEMIDTHFDYLHSFARDVFTAHEQRTIVAQGEIISSSLLHFSLEESGVQSVLLPALEFMRLDENGEPDLPTIREKLGTRIQESSGPFITQGYICRNVFGEIDNLKRGGSDYTASLIGAALQCEEIQIWTDIDGLHNNDPRFVANTRSIRELSFDEAAELAYFGAKILHPSSVLPAQQFNIPVRLLNTMSPAEPGTLITGRKTRGQIKAVAAKDGICAIKIKSSRMLLAHGFLRRIFEVFEFYKTSIDMITTSEVAVSVTIDNPAHLDAIAHELEQFGSVEVDRDQTIICVVGDFVAESRGVALRVIGALEDIPLRMICYGGSSHNISLLISSNLKTRALNALHRGLFDVQ